MATRTSKSALSEGVHLLKSAVICILASYTVVPMAAAQWYIAAEVTTTHFSGSSAEITPTEDELALRPYRPLFYGLRIERGGGKVRVGLGLHAAAPGLAFAGNDVTIVSPGALTVLGAAPELSLRLIGGLSDALRVQAGPLVEGWELDQYSYRARFGVHASISYEFELAGRFGSAVRASVARIGSPFDEFELPAGFERRAAWRRGVALGLRYRL